MKAHTYLHFGGNCEEAMDFYKDILGGQITTLMRFSDAPKEVFTAPDLAQNWIMHCTLEFGGALLMASDFLNDDKEKFNLGNNFAVSINVDSIEEGQKIFDGLVSEGELFMPFSDAFWGGKFGMLRDKFGVSWMISSEHKTE